jgi:hypothetical protein
LYLIVTFIVLNRNSEMFYKNFIIYFLILFIVPQLTAQLKMPQASIESGTAITHGDYAPFWLSANKYGYISDNPFSIWIRPIIKTEIDWNKRFDYSYGLDIWGRYDGAGKLFLQQGWIKSKILFVTVYGGRMEEIFGNQDSTLSSGGLLWSGNAPPMPKLAVLVEHWTPVPFTHKYFDFKGGLSHGWFGDQPFVKDAFMHHKYAYIRFGGKLPVHIQYGLHHFAQWGGTSQLRGKFPDDLKAYLDVFFARNTEIQYLPDGTPVANRSGNHLGSRNFGLDIDLKTIKINSYWQTVFEDGSGKAYRNIKDGLWGLTLKTKSKSIISGLLYEFLHTTDQSGRFNWDPLTLKEYGGNDDYFNHGFYNYGWTYNGFTLGTPLITSPFYITSNSSDYIRNNRIIAHHIGFEGYKGYLSYRLLYTYSLNYGTNFYPFESTKHQHSFMINTHFSDVLPFKIDLGLNLGIDIGKMYGNNFGIQILLKKSF